MDQVLEWDAPFAKWFVGGKLNVAYNCIDRHVEAGLGDKVAFDWEGEPGDTKSITYAELLVEVSKTANALKELGVQKGDRVAVYMPMILETPIALLACARIGAPHTMVFGGFSAQLLLDRMTDATCKVVITADGGYRRGAAAALKPNVDIALEDAPSVERCSSPNAPAAMSRCRLVGRVVERNCQPPKRRLPARAHGQRGYAVPALHLWHHGEAKRHRPHYCRVSVGVLVDAQGGIRPQG